LLLGNAADALLIAFDLPQTRLNLFQTELEQQLLRFYLERIKPDEQQMKRCLPRIRLNPSRMKSDEGLMAVKKCRLSSSYDGSSLIRFSFDRTSSSLNGRRSCCEPCGSALGAMQGSCGLMFAGRVVMFCGLERKSWQNTSAEHESNCRGFRFFFFSREESRKHAHVYCSDGEAKFWLDHNARLG
jgi:hypothetical protein